MRIVSNPAHGGRRTTVGDAAGRLRQLTNSEGHAFWSDDLSVLDVERFGRPPSRAPSCGTCGSWTRSG